MGGIFSKEALIKSGVTLAVVAVVSLAGYQYYKTYTTLKQTEATLASSQKDNADLTKNLETATQQLNAERERNDRLEEQVTGIADTVGTLDKLSKTDPELLKRYSKVYFLSENYVPKSLVTIPARYLSDKTKEQKILTDVWPQLERMLDNATRGGNPLLIASAYRSFGEQSTLKSGYKFSYGAGTANQFSADQGYSEHQLGTAIDFTTPKLSTNFDTFAKTPSYTWLLDNAHKYGFILSYPDRNTFYVFEPWHWRYVGVDLATMLHNTKRYFYGIPQRDIDAYLVKLFD